MSADDCTTEGSKIEDPVIIEDGDEDDEELQTAIAMSLSVPRPATVAAAAVSEFSSAGEILLNNIDRLTPEANRGAVTFSRLTRARGVPPEAVLLSSFGEDIDFIMKHFGRCPIIFLVRHFSPSPEEPPGIHALKGGKVTVVHPAGLASGGGIMHVKLMILRFRYQVRVVVSSANLTAPEWSEIAQVVWIADFPSLPIDSPARGAFADDLSEVLSELLGPSEAVRWCRGFDASGTSSRLVFSSPRARPATSMCPGLPTLQRLVHSCCPAILSSCSEVYFATASLGALSRELLCEFPGVKRPNASNARIMFPSETTIAVADAAGFSGKEVISLSPAHFRSKAFPRSLLREFRHSNRSREPILNHGKIIAWLGESGSPLAIFLGSHNLTGSAWGFPTPSRWCSSKNFELGVLVTTLPAGFVLPFAVPAPDYCESDKPWTRKF